MYNPADSRVVTRWTPYNDDDQKQYQYPDGRPYYTRRARPQYYDLPASTRPWLSGWSKCMIFITTVAAVAIIALVIALIYKNGKSNDEEMTSVGGQFTTGPMGPQTGPGVSDQSGGPELTEVPQTGSGQTGPGQTGGPATPGSGQTGSGQTGGPATPGSGQTGSGQTGGPATPGSGQTGSGQTGGPATPGSGQTGSGQTGGPATPGSGQTGGPATPGSGQTGSGQTGGPATPGSGQTGSQAAPGSVTGGTSPGGGVTGPKMTTGMMTEPQVGPIVIPDCPMDSPLVIHRRVDASEFFSRTWAEMKAGFGSPTSNYWAGLEAMHQITSTQRFSLIVDYNSTSGATYSVTYSTFLVGDEASGYPITIGGFAGSFVVDAFTGYSGYKFTTKDRQNNDGASNCAVELMAAWWYGQCTCNACLTQPDQGYKWALGFNEVQLSSHTLSLDCKGPESMP